jgi:hypothetical protein
MKESDRRQGEKKWQISQKERTQKESEEQEKSKIT